MGSAEGVAVGNEIDLLAVTEIVLGGGSVSSEDLHSWGSLDSIPGGEVTVGHNVDGSEQDFLAFEQGVLGSLGVLFREGSAVWAPVGVESNNPSVIGIVLNFIGPGVGGKLDNTLAIEKSGVDGGCKNCKAGSKA